MYSLLLVSISRMPRSLYELEPNTQIYRYHIPSCCLNLLFNPSPLRFPLSLLPLILQLLLEYTSLQSQSLKISCYPKHFLFFVQGGLTKKGCMRPYVVFIKRVTFSFILSFMSCELQLDRYISDQTRPRKEIA